MSEQFDAQTKVIDEIEYKVVPFPAGTGFEILFDLNQAFGDSIGALLGREAEKALSKIGGSLGKTEVLNLIIRMLQWTYIGSSPQPITKETFNMHFAGRYGHLLKVVGFVIEVNFKDFFDECRNGMLQAVRQMNQVVAAMTAGSPSSSPSTSDGDGGS